MIIQHRSDVKFAFEMLFEEIGATIKSLNKEGADAFTNNQPELASKIADQVRQIRDFTERLKEFYDEWSNLEANLFGKSVEKAGNDFVGQRLPKGLRIPEDKFRLPILETLHEMGGFGQIKDVLSRVYEKMKENLNEYDLKTLPSSSETPRWFNTAQWCRAQMVKEGLLRSNSPYGVWEIDDAGLEELKKKGGC